MRTAPPFGLDTTLLHTFKRGVDFDSSWRHKTAGGCPFTFLATVDQTKRIVPSKCIRGSIAKRVVAAMISQHSDIDMYTFMLQTVMKVVERPARELVEGRCKSTVLKDNEEVLATWAEVAAQDAFLPSFDMIDGDDAERSALAATWPGMSVPISPHERVTKQGLHGLLKWSCGRRQS